MATKEHRRQAKGLIEGLESRVHVGPPIHQFELVSAREFLVQSDFSPASDYFSRLLQVQNRLGSRSNELVLAPTKRNYGGEAASRWLQVQSAYDHVIVSTCYEGEFNRKRGRVKISHRFNQEGRIDFVELKFLRPLDLVLAGGLRKLLTVKDFAGIRKDWTVAEAFALEVLPRELVFLYSDIFRCERSELLAWLANIGHRLAAELLEDLRHCRLNGHDRVSERNPDQLCLTALLSDEVAWPILEKTSQLQSAVEIRNSKTVLVRYSRA